MLYSKYGTMIDRDSAYEFFQRKLKQQETFQKQQEELGARKKEQEKAEREAQKDALRQ